MFETNRAAVLPMRAYLARLVRCAGVGLLIAAGILGIETIGYRCFAGLPWVESFENATMVFFKDRHLTTPETPSGRLLVIVFAFSCRLAGQNLRWWAFFSPPSFIVLITSSIVIQHPSNSTPALQRDERGQCIA